MKDSYPLLQINDTLDTLLVTSTILSSLDLKSVDWQLDMAPSDKEKIAFSIVLGLY